MTARKDEAPPDDEAPTPPRRVTLCTAIPWATFHYTGSDGSVIDGDLVITNTGVSLPADAATEVAAAARWSGVPLLEKD